ncbi:MAG: hypothetical protein JW784_04360 [Candidatus Cloacimonetes bacterium]|nr:hypothetical protein [Candidatus Cloacimonadota bacterium]
MSNRTLTILVLISLAFNLAFMGGAVYLRLKAGSRLHRITDFRENHPEFRAFIQGSRQEIKVYRDDFEHSRHEFIRLLCQPEIDDSLLIRTLNLTIDKQNLMERELGMLMIEMRKMMTHHQACLFFRHLEDNRPQSPFPYRPFHDKNNQKLN